MLLLLALTACPPATTPPSERHLAVLTDLGDRAEALTASPDGGLWAVVDGRLHHDGGDGFVDLGRGDLPPGGVVALMATSDGLLAQVQGKGAFRSADGATWTPIGPGLSSPVLGLLNPEATPAPLASHVDGDTTWIAAAGGLFRSDDGAATVQAVPTGMTGSVAVLFTDVAARGEDVVAVSMLPASMLPAAFAGALSGTVFRSADGGATWSDASDAFPSAYPTAAHLDDDGVAWVGTMDRGVLRQDGAAWTEVGGPTDVVAIDALDDGLLVGSASRGAWWRRDGGWTRLGDVPTVGVAGGVALLHDGRVIGPGGGASDPLDPGGARVHIALSFHGNYYHSYRGDSPTDDGFGQDIRVIRTTLDWLDAQGVPADWDFDNAWTTDRWGPEHSPDVLTRVRARVAAGLDEVRLMSWNNGAMAAMTREEFGEAVERAKVSNAAAFGAWVPGVQPQENMVSPAHLAWYPEHDITWITLFNAANGFSGVRPDVALTGRAAFGPVTLRPADGPGAMTLVPVYHHADVLDHGGLVGWARQLHAAYDDDVLLVIHFDADAETWESFEPEVAAAKELAFATFTTIGRYLDAHPAVGDAILPGDLADGTGDGFQSWAEKDLNHAHYTDITRVRRALTAARLLAPTDPAVTAAADAAMTPLLLALSTTNFGLAAPTLHPDRVASARAQVAEAQAHADDALDAALPALDDDEVLLVPLRAGGRTPVTLTLPAATDDVAVWRDEVELPAHVTRVDAQTVTVGLVIDPGAPERLRWAPTGGAARGPLRLQDAPALAALRPPLVGCRGEGETPGALVDATPWVSARGLVAGVTETWDLPTCGATSRVTRALERWDGVPGVVVRVFAAMATPADPSRLQSVVLAPLACDAPLDALTWRTLSGATPTRPARRGVETWNGQHVDGWVTAACGDTTLTVHVDPGQRTSMAALPVRNEGSGALLAPLGALWGDGAWLDPRATGGHGVGALIVPVVGSQFRPPAVDWAGADVAFTLLITDGEVVDAFGQVVVAP